MTKRLITVNFLETPFRKPSIEQFVLDNDRGDDAEIGEVVFVVQVNGTDHAWPLSTIRKITNEPYGDE